ncbi:MAG: dATP/dGTP diphosphohydrolase domain-containing protein [Lamprobacter sp.]|uniref:dATP/dGTP diphosphohydrolase domain-containing protein n=1 Tax=Lamprobacter sp. TaxID=3100796 RepID=UPI002B26265B|nr:dATP/dGTP diphosphohydrolase domain-containing protein [Lamprobacter sp.]MEA3639923.1 dATP/dGTP diphosphohydrolase domain-containing protein [Lamprobacter sp.]
MRTRQSWKTRSAKEKREIMDAAIAGIIEVGRDNLHVPGAKDDAGKPRMGLVLFGFQNALVEVAKVGTFGAKKYSDNGWEHVDDGQARYTDAMLRHIFGAGNTDPETGLLHMAHAAWNCLAVLELMLRNREWEDD